MVGVYCGNDPGAILQFEGWFGRKVDGIPGYTGGASWEDYDGSVPWVITPYLESTRRWFDSQNVIFHTYWNSNADYPGMLSEKQYPTAAESYRALFGPEPKKQAKSG